MDLCLRRRPATDGVTLGQLFVDGCPECWTLEKVAVQIPAGRYPVTITRSYRFMRDLPLINNVVGRTGIRIHAGNSGSDTAGCILVGQTPDRERIEQSRAALNRLQPKIAEALARHGAVWLVIEDVGPAPLAA